MKLDKSDSSVSGFVVTNFKIEPRILYNTHKGLIKSECKN